MHSHQCCCQVSQQLAHMTGAGIPFYAFHKFIDYGDQFYDTHMVYMSRMPQPVDPFYNLLKPFHRGN